jgi:hydroxymethylpyrimidine pyrophosphatase-like HAD family hydrolase
MSPRLLALDVDGTLADPAGVVRERTRAAVAAASAAGMFVVVATGRPWLVAERTVAELGVAGWAVCSNGAMTVRVDDGAVLRNVFLPDDLAPRLLPLLRDDLPGIGFALEFERGAKAEAGWARRLPPGVPLGPPVDDVLTLVPERGRVRKIIAFHDDHDHDIAGLAVRLRAAAGMGVLVQHSGLAFCEIGMPGVDKAVAVAELCASLGVERSEVVAFGDEVNDAELLTWAGHGVAMANAADAARAAADEVTLSNDADGVAHWIETNLVR